MSQSRETNHEPPFESLPDQKTADTVALELLKQLITLSSGVLALSATFAAKFEADRVYLFVLLGIAWFLLLLSIYAGLQAMSALVKALTHPHFTFVRDRLYTYARTSKFSFAAGISVFATFAFF